MGNVHQVRLRVNNLIQINDKKTQYASLLFAYSDFILT
jgi:hypothetical protein